MENRVRHLIFSASSLTTALAIAVPSKVAVPLPGDKIEKLWYTQEQKWQSKASVVYLLQKTPPLSIKTEQ